MPERIFNIIFNEDEVTWQTLLLELVKAEDMDPWDIDVSELSHKYIGMVKEMRKTDLRVSGKVLLAASILLRIKSQRFLNDDIASFDNMMYEPEEETDFLEEGEGQKIDRDLYKKLKLIPKTPQPRKRKVSIYDLVDALQQALEVNKRRIERIPVVNIQIPEKKVDISQIMGNVFGKIMGIFKTEGKKTVKFSQLVPDDTKAGKVYTFIPLLHLYNQRKIDLEQEGHFADFDILLNKNHNEIMKELSEQEA